MILRPATLADTDILYEWRLEAEQAKWWHGTPTTKISHIKTLTERLASPSVHLWIAEENETPVGMCRVDSNGEISYHVDQQHRNRGLGTKIVQAACALTRGRVKASVAETNTASRKVLERAGFQPDPSVLFYVRR